MYETVGKNTREDELQWENDSKTTVAQSSCNSPGDSWAGAVCWGTGNRGERGMRWKDTYRCKINRYEGQVRGPWKK